MFTSSYVCVYVYVYSSFHLLLHYTCMSMCGCVLFMCTYMLMPVRMPELTYNGSRFFIPAFDGKDFLFLCSLKRR
jgi:hypothetical protein